MVRCRVLGRWIKIFIAKLPYVGTDKQLHNEGVTVLSQLIDSVSSVDVSTFINGKAGNSFYKVEDEIFLLVPGYSKFLHLLIR